MRLIAKSHLTQAQRKAAKFMLSNGCCTAKCGAVTWFLQTTDIPGFEYSIHCNRDTVEQSNGTLWTQRSFFTVKESTPCKA